MLAKLGQQISLTRCISGFMQIAGWLWSILLRNYQLCFPFETAVTNVRSVAWQFQPQARYRAIKKVVVRSVNPGEETPS